MVFIVLNYVFEHLGKKVMKTGWALGSPSPTPPNPDFSQKEKLDIFFLRASLCPNLGVNIDTLGHKKALKSQKIAVGP